MPETEQLVTQLAEAIHRAKNDLQTIASMLQLQAKMSENEAVNEALTAAYQRVIAIARVNKALDGTMPTEPRVNVQTFLKGIAADLQAATQGRPITIQALPGPALPLSVSYARSIGLVVNEWVTNALKYAFREQRPGIVTIALTVHNQACHLTVRDEGMGIDTAAKPRGTGLGTRLAQGLAQGLARQVQGKLTVEREARGGTRCALTFPMPTH